MFWQEQDTICKMQLHALPADTLCVICHGHIFIGMRVFVFHYVGFFLTM